MSGGSQNKAQQNIMELINMTTATKKAVAKKTKTEVSAAPIDFTLDEGAGFEEADVDSFAVPFVRILQSMSPQCKKSDGAYIQGAEEGAIFNTATEEVMETLDVIPCHYRRVFIEWVPQDQGGGFVAEHSVESGKGMEVDDEYMLPNGNQLMDTRMHYCIDAKDGSPMVICFSSSQIKKSRKLMTVMDKLKKERQGGGTFTPAMFASVFHITTVPESNDKGSWFGWKFTREGDTPTMELYQAGKTFRNLVVGGSTKVDHNQGKEAQPEENENF